MASGCCVLPVAQHTILLPSALKNACCGLKQGQEVLRAEQYLIEVLCSSVAGGCDAHEHTGQAQCQLLHTNECNDVPMLSVAEFVSLSLVFWVSWSLWLVNAPPQRMGDPYPDWPRKKCEV